MSAEHIHLLLNHLPIHGLAVATFILLIGLIAKNRVTIAAACLGILVSSLSIPIVMGSGEAAYDRYKLTPEIRETLTDQGMVFAHTHYENAEKGAKLTYLLILLCAAALISLKYKPGWFGKLAWGIFSLALLALLANAWIASSGGKIRRPDFQNQAELLVLPENH